MKRRRDAQRFRTYRAEHEWQNALKAHGLCSQFESLGDMQSYTYGVHRWVRTHKASIRGMMNTVVPEDAPEIRAAPRGNTSTAYMNLWHIDMASRETQRSYHWTECMLLHELAHMYAKGERHGPVWAVIYLQLVRQWMGKEAGAILVEKWKKYKVKYSMPRPSRRKKLSPAERAAFTERMQKARKRIPRAKNLKALGESLNQILTLSR